MPGLNGSQTFAAHAAAVAQDAPAAFAPCARQKAVLPPASPFGRLILSFHKFSSVSAPKFRPRTTQSGDTPATGTREHNSEEPSVKRGGSSLSRLYENVPLRTQ